MTSTYDLITLAEAQTFPGMSNADVSILAALITAASLDFETFWDNYGVQRQVAERYSYREIKISSAHANTIWLRKLPIVSVASIVDQDSNAILSTDYWIDYDLGALRTTGGWYIPHDANGFETYWTVTYTAGRVADTASVPANIKHACKMWVAELFKNSSQNVTSKSVGDLRISYKETKGDLPDQIKRMIGAWKKADA